jgi:hypothetical protein
MLQELSMVEQRYQAVREVLDSEASITEVATRYRRTIMSAATRRSSRPSCARKT